VRNWRWPWFLGLAVAAVALLIAAPWGAERGAGELGSPTFGDAFWKLWGDGHAELAGYDLSYSRYGELRRGTAVTIFVSETFANNPRVKHEDPGRGESETVPVMKLNLMQDFPTGIYDYNLMTSAFVALAAANGLPAGRPTKVAFSSQDWCGQVYSQLLFDSGVTRFESHSYFDGEANQERALDAPENGVAEDALLLWARGMTAPLLEPGQRREVKLLRSLELSRLGHLPPAWENATLSRSDRIRTIVVPAGEFEVDELGVAVSSSSTNRSYPPTHPRIELPSRTWTFYVEHAPPYRVIKWERDDGTSAELLASSRLQYWALHGPGFETELKKLGLKARPPRTP